MNGKPNSEVRAPLVVLRARAIISLAITSTFFSAWIILYCVALYFHPDYCIVICTSCQYALQTTTLSGVLTHLMRFHKCTPQQRGRLWPRMSRLLFSRVLIKSSISNLRQPFHQSLNSRPLPMVLRVSSALLTRYISAAKA